jgi:hypothetical protein
MAVRVERQAAAHDRLLVAVLRASPETAARAAQDGLHALGQQAGGAGLADEIVGADVEADTSSISSSFEVRKIAGRLEVWRRLPQQLHAVHLRHLHVEDGDVRRRLRGRQGSRAIVIGADLVAFGSKNILSEATMFSSSSTRAMVAITMESPGGRPGVYHGAP